MAPSGTPRYGGVSGRISYKGAKIVRGGCVTGLSRSCMAGILVLATRSRVQGLGSGEATVRTIGEQLVKERASERSLRDQAVRAFACNIRAAASRCVIRDGAG